MYGGPGVPEFRSSGVPEWPEFPGFRSSRGSGVPGVPEWPEFPWSSIDISSGNIASTPYFPGIARDALRPSSSSLWFGQTQACPNADQLYIGGV